MDGIASCHRSQQRKQVVNITSNAATCAPITIQGVIDVVRELKLNARVPAYVKMTQVQYDALRAEAEISALFVRRTKADATWSNAIHGLPLVIAGRFDPYFGKPCLDLTDIAHETAQGSTSQS